MAGPGSGLLPDEGVHYIGGSDTLPPPLEKKQEAELLERLEDPEARKTLIEHNLRLVVYIARRFENTGVGLEDLHSSIGTIGLIKAVGTYRTDKNIKLATYASRCMSNEILMYLRKNAARKSEVSFDEPLNTDWDGNELLLSDVLGTEADTVMRPIEEGVDRQLLAEAVHPLSREKQIITMRFGLGGIRERTQKEVADQLGISQSYISRLENEVDTSPAEEEDLAAVLTQNLDNPGGVYYTIQEYNNCEEGKQYPAGGCQEKARMVRAPVKPLGKSSRSIGLNHQ